MRASGIILVLLLVVQAYAQDASGDAATGERLFYSFACYSCHGYGGTGRTPLSPETSGILSSEALFLTYLRLRADQNPVNPKNSMPNYSASTLSDEQALDIYAYIKSFKDDPPEFADIPVFVEILESARQRAGNE